ncbi:MAG: PAS domain S-box protein [Candidatus Competibacteraceae bacterium]
MDIRRMQSELSRNVNQLILLSLGVIVLLTSITYLLLRRFVLQPVKAIQIALQRRQAGETGVYTPALAADELNVLGAALNSLIDELSTGEHRFRTVVESIPSAIVVANADGDIALVNAQAEKLFGYARKEMIGRSIVMLMPDLATERHMAHQRTSLQMLQTQQVGRGQLLSALRQDGLEIPVEISLSPLRINGDDLVLGVIMDVTERRRDEDAIRKLNETLERRVEERTKELAHTVERLNREIKVRRDQEVKLVQAQKMEAIGQLTGGIAHDFNNLLTIVKGNLELLQRALASRLSSEEWGLIEDALSAAGSGAELTSRLLTFSRRQALNPRRADLNRLLDEFGRMLRRLLSADVALRLDTDPGIPDVVVDAGQLQNALLNLALNAQDAMPTGGTLALRSRLVEIDAATDAPVAGLALGRYVEVAVADSGVGMDEETLQRVFEPFFTTKGAGKGSGLGLAMVYGFAAQSGGGVAVDSQLNQGTVVRLLLPAAGVAELAATATDKEVVPGGTETILVVEDDELVRRIATRHLRGLGYTVLEAADAEDAMAILETEPEIDLVFSDILMPGPMDGYALANWVVTERPDLRCLLTTGYSGMRGQQILPSDAPPRPVLAKPYSREQLAQRIRAVLDGDGDPL